MNSDYRNGHASVILAAISSMLTAVCFVGFLLCAACARGDDGSIVKALVRLGGSNEQQNASNSVTLAHGTVLVEKHGASQRFVVQVKNIPLPAAGLAVFLGNSPVATNGSVFVDVLSKTASTNDQWQLDLEGNNGAPPFLGVDDVESLAGKFVFVVDETTNVFLRTMITGLQPKLSPLSYRAHAKLIAPAPAPSRHASGIIRVKYDAKLGASLLDIRGRNLAAGNSYCVIYTPETELPPGTICEGTGDNLTKGKGFVHHDTGKGDDLPYGVDWGVTTIADLAGLNVFVLDPFGALHLVGTIPGPK